MSRQANSTAASRGTSVTQQGSTTAGLSLFDANILFVEDVLFARVTANDGTEVTLRGSSYTGTIATVTDE